MAAILLLNLSLGLMAQNIAGPTGEVLADNPGSNAGTANYSVKAEPMIIGPNLYMQEDNLSGYYALTVAYTNPDFNTYNVATADDFIVPEGDAWDIKYARFTIYTPFLLDSIQSWNVFIYSDNAGKPGDVISQEKGITNIYYETRPENASMYDVTLELTSALTLATAGKYWISAEPVTEITSLNSYNDPNFWAGFMLQENNTSINTQAQIKNNGGYFSLISWSNMSTYWISTAGLDRGYKNLNFSLYGSEKAFDLAIESIESPSMGAELTSNETVRLIIQNHGTTDIEANTYQVHFRVDGGTWTDVEEGLAVSSGAEIYYTLHEVADLSAKGIHTIEAELIYATDEYSDNNVLSKEIENYGIVYPAVPGTKVNYTTCEGTFTDHGGLGDTYEYSTDTITFFPGQEGHRIRLEFYDTQMSGAYMFRFFNGSSTDAPQILQLDEANSNVGVGTQGIPGLVVEGVNSEGALTIIIPSWDAGTNNLMAAVSCVKNESIDFTLTELNLSKPFSWQGETIKLEASVCSRGTDAGNTLVTFMANNVEIGSVSTTALAFGETEIVSVDWTPEAAGIYDVSANVPLDDGQNVEEKEFAISHEILAIGQLAEGFELEQFPPDGWVSNLPGGSSRYYMWYNDQPYWEGEYKMALNGDTLVMPKLDVSVTDTLEFLFSAGYFGGTCSLLYASSIDGPWKVAHTVSYGMPYVTNYKATLKRAVGVNYVAFSGNGCSIDYVRGANVYIPDYDLQVVDLKGNIDPQLGIETMYTLKIRNMGSKETLGSDYSVKLWQKIDGVATEITSINGETITLANYKEFTFTHIFTEQIVGSVYATIDYANDLETNNNTSSEIEFQVIKPGVEYIYAGNEDSEINDPYSLAGYFGNYSEILFSKEELNTKGEISGISLYYYNSIPFNFDLEIYIKEDAANELSDGFNSTMNMVKVFDAALMVNDTKNKFQQIYIPFDTPYLYSGDNNLILAFYRVPPINCDDFGSSVSLQATDKGKVVLYNHGFQCYEKDTDISNSIALNALISSSSKTFAPNIQFYVKTTEMDASLAGTVTDLVANGLENALLSLGGYANIALTDADGNYSFPVIPYGDVDVTAELYGYYDQTKTGTFTAANQTKVDFSMESLPTVEVIGSVIANDSLNPVAGVEVFMEGYNNTFYTVADDDGKFVLDGVYGDKTYDVSFVHPKYVTYNQQINVPFEGFDMGTITLDEVEQPAFNVIASVADDSQVNVSWETPYTGVENVFDPTGGAQFDNYWYNEPDENVQMGNIFKVSSPGTVTSIEISNWAWQGASSGELYLRFYDQDQKEFLKPVSFMMPDSTVDWMQIDVPDFTYTDDFYVMIHWNKVHQQTTAIAYSFTDANNAYLADASGKFYLLTDYVQEYYNISSESHTLSIRANILESGSKTSKALISYDLYRNSLPGIFDGTPWTKLNDNPIEDANQYNDDAYNELSNNHYIYAVQANYTKANAEYCYSNTLEKGLHSRVDFNVTANNSENIDGAYLTLTNDNGVAINTYKAQVAGGKVSFDRVLNGDYSLTIENGRAYWDYYDDFAIAKDTTISVVLEEYIFTPSNLTIQVDDTVAKQAVFSWGLGDKVIYSNDNNTVGTALAPELGYNVGLGNYFETFDNGTIFEFDVYGYDNGTNEDGLVKIVVYNNNQEVIAQTDEFVIQEGWFKVATSTIPFNGSFFAMLEWNIDETRQTNWLGADYSDGVAGGAYMRTDDYGFEELIYNGLPASFLLRANAFVGSKKSTIEPSNLTVNTIDVAVSQRIKKQDLSHTGMLTVNNPKSVNYFNVFLTDLITPIASGITGQSFTFTEAEHLLVEGLNTYEAGVQAVYETGSSVVITESFVYDRVTSVNQELDAKVSMYPNPANNAITIVGAENGTIEFVNSIGKTVALIDTYNNLTRVDVSTLHNGVYIIKVTTDSGTITRNLVINK
jgi:hypothetical protein